MRNYFTALDFSKNLVLFAPSAGSVNIPDEEGAPKGLSTFWIIVYSFSGVMLIALIVNIFYFCYKRVKKRKALKQEQIQVIYEKNESAVLERKNKEENEAADAEELLI